MSKKPIIAIQDPKTDKFSPENLAENNRKIRAQANPLVSKMMDHVQTALDEENALMDAQFAADAKLRAWAKDLLGYKISMTQIEELKAEIAKATPGKSFLFQQTSLIKTVFNTVDRVDNYIFALEKTIVDLTNKMVPSKESANQFTGLSFFGLIKLAFKQLFNRSK